MAVVSCPRCGASVEPYASDGVLFCMPCGVEFDFPVAPPGKPARSKAWWWLAGVGLLMVAGWIIRLVDPDVPSATAGTAHAAAKHFLALQLKAPDSAEFSGLGESSAGPARDEPGIWRVRGWVKAQNSFGVPLRQRFDCSLRFRDGKWFWVEGGVVK